MRRLVPIAVIATLLVGAVVAYANLNWPGGGQPHHAPKHLRIKGHVTGLYPGARRILRAKVFNRTHEAVVLRDLRVEVSDAGPGCGKSNLRARDNTRPITIQPHHRRRLKVPVTMRPHAPGACRGARFPLHFHATFGRAP